MGEDQGPMPIQARAELHGHIEGFVVAAGGFGVLIAPSVHVGQRMPRVHLPLLVASIALQPERLVAEFASQLVATELAMERGKSGERETFAVRAAYRAEQLGGLLGVHHSQIDLIARWSRWFCHAAEPKHHGLRDVGMGPRLADAVTSQLAVLERLEVVLPRRGRVAQDVGSRGEADMKL